MDPVLVKYIVFSLIALIYNGSLIGAVLYSLEHQIDINWCSGSYLCLLHIIQGPQKYTINKNSMKIEDF